MMTARNNTEESNVSIIERFRLAYFSNFEICKKIFQTYEPWFWFGGIFLAWYYIYDIVPWYVYALLAVFLIYAHNYSIYALFKRKGYTQEQVQFAIQERGTFAKLMWVIIGYQFVSKFFVSMSLNPGQYDLITVAKYLVDQEGFFSTISFLAYHGHIFVYFYSLYFYRQERAALLYPESFLKRTKYMHYASLIISAMFLIGGIRFLYVPGGIDPRLNVDVNQIFGIVFFTFSLIIFMISLPLIFARNYAQLNINGPAIEYLRKPIVYINPKFQNHINDFEVKPHGKQS